jgi:hypothetical protein
MMRPEITCRYCGEAIREHYTLFDHASCLFPAARLALAQLQGQIAHVRGQVAISRAQKYNLKPFEYRRPRASR